MKKQLTLPFIRDGPAASIQLGVYSINSIYQLLKLPTPMWCVEP